MGNRTEENIAEMFVKMGIPLEGKKYKYLYPINNHSLVKAWNFTIRQSLLPNELC